MTPKINYQRMLDTFIKLTKVCGPSCDEGNIAKAVEAELKKIGCKTAYDDAGKKFETSAKGNLTASFKGTVESAPFVLAAHLDTVTPCKDIKPVIKKNMVFSDGTTILGADDRAGIAIIIEVMRALKESKAKYPPVEALFTLCEETGMYGSKNIDIKKLKGREGIILDSEEQDFLIIGAPAAVTFNVKIKGKASHAGAAPEKGVSAIEMAAYALSIMKLGRIDFETVANFGIINGGSATNVVTPELFMQGEARSRNMAKLKKQVAHMKDCFKKAEKKFIKKIDGKVFKPAIEVEVKEKYPALNIPPKSALIKLICDSAKKHGLNLKTALSGGGFDANILFSKGLNTPIIGIGYGKEHTTEEFLDLNIYNKAADITLETALNYRK